MFNLTKTQWILIALVIAVIFYKTKEHLQHCESVNSGTIPDGCNILNQQECEEWAESRSKTFKGEDYFCQSSTDCPKGCYVMNSKVYWNNNKTGSCTANRICVYKDE